ncbi:MAG: hypothetical protein J5I90_22635 [Caldilineales bacterium]|nr:hypothetical protein [Caldilineales bacterium]
MNKTGTTTLAVCLKRLGFKHTSYSLDLLRHVKRGEWEPVWAVSDAFDSFEDWPWPLTFKEMDERYPYARFILTVRKDSETWISSLLKHAERTGPTQMRELVYGYAMPQGHEAEHIAIYEAHNLAVADHFADRPEKLLTLCWETGSDWADLGQFLQMEVPDESIPHANKASTASWRRLQKRVKHGLKGILTAD